MVDDVVGAMESDLVEVLELLDAVELLRVIGVTPEPLREGIGIAACVAGFFCSGAGVSVDAAGLIVLPLPGRGK